MTLRLPAEGKIVDEAGRWTPDFRNLLQGLLPATGLSKDEVLRLKDVVKKFYGGGSELDISGYVESQSGLSINGSDVSEIATGSGLVVDVVSKGSVTLNTVAGGLMVYGAKIPPASRSNTSSHGAVSTTSVFAVPYYFPTRTNVTSVDIGIYRTPISYGAETVYFSLGLYTNKRTYLGDVPFKRIVSGESWVINGPTGFTGENFVECNCTVDPGVYWQLFNASTSPTYAGSKLDFKTDVTSTSATGAGTAPNGGNVIALVRSGSYLLDDESGESWQLETTLAPFLYYR